MSLLQEGERSKGLFDNTQIMSVYQQLRKDCVKSERALGIIHRIENAGPIMVIDPEKAYYDLDATLERVRIASQMGIEVIEIGGSTDKKNEAQSVIPRIKEAIKEVEGKTLLISFPGTGSQVIEGVDASLSLFMPQLDEVFRKNPQIAEIFTEQYFEIISKSRTLGVPIIPVTYLIFNAGKKTSVEKVTGIEGINVESGVNSGQIMEIISPWLKESDLVMLEAGSGPSKFVNLGPVAREVYEVMNITPIVTGGISSPEQMQEILQYIKCPIVFGSVGENTPPSEFGNLYQSFRNAHPSCDM